MRCILVGLMLLVSVPAFAQTTQTPLEQAMTSKLSEELNQNIQYRAKLIQQQQEIDDLKKRLSEKK